MGLLVLNLGETHTMEMNQSNCCSTKTERKDIEKNRRNRMKSLYSKLNSLVPSLHAKESMPLPDQIDEAINYIKSLEERLKKAKEKKESLTGSRKRPRKSTDLGANSSSLKSPQLEIRESGSALEIVLITGQHNQFLFNDTVSILNEESVDVVNASFSVTEDSVFHSIHAEIRESALAFGAARVTERLNRFINGSTSELELESDFWDLEIHPEMWDFRDCNNTQDHFKYS